MGIDGVGEGDAFRLSVKYFFLHLPIVPLSWCGCFAMLLLTLMANCLHGLYERAFLFFSQSNRNESSYCGIAHILRCVFVCFVCCCCCTPLECTHTVAVVKFSFNGRDHKMWNLMKQKKINQITFHLIHISLMQFRCAPVYAHIKTKSNDFYRWLWLWFQCHWIYFLKLLSKRKPIQINRWPTNLYQICVRAFESNIDAIGFVQSAFKAHNPFGLNCKNWPRPKHVCHYHLALTLSLFKHTHAHVKTNEPQFFFNALWNLYYQFTWIVFSTRTKTAPILNTLDHGARQ